MVSTGSITTAEELFEAGDIGRCELIRGQVVMMTPAGGEHGRMMIKLGALLQTYVAQHRLGIAYAGDPGFVIERNPDTVRAPDIAFIAAERAREVHTHKFIAGPPDLAVEIVSPDDRRRELVAKARQWLSSGAQTVWVADPMTKTVTVYHAGGEERLLHESDTLTGEPTLPGFSVSVADLFAF